jgi:hypothetical protein
MKKVAKRAGAGESRSTAFIYRSLLNSPDEKLVVRCRIIALR